MNHVASRWIRSVGTGSAVPALVAACLSVTAAPAGAVEPLDPVAIQEWKVPYGGRPRDPFAAGADEVWFVGQQGHYLARLTPSTGEFHERKLPGKPGPHNLIVGSDGIVWYAGNLEGYIGRYDPKAPPAQQFRTPVHCADLSNDGLVYVCDRPNDRLQVFKSDGTFVKEMFVARDTLGDGSTWDVAFSKDPQQTYLYLADGKNEKVYVIARATMQILTSFGDGGRQPGQFFGVHSIATDSKGNIYTTETYEGRRLQKFVYRGLAPVTTLDQGTVWPAK